MSDVYVSEMLRSTGVLRKSGLCPKFYGEDWPDEPVGASKLPPRVNKAWARHQAGEVLPREDFPEAAFVHSEHHFA